MSWEDNIRRVTPYVPGEQPRVTGRLIKLNTNECPYPPSPEVSRILREMPPGDMRLYPDPEAVELKDALSEVYGVPRERIFVGVGSDDVLSMAFMTFFHGSLPVLFPDVTYSFYEVWAELHGVSCRKVPLDGGLNIDISDYEGPCGGIVFPNPNAPTGIYMGLEKVETLVGSHPDCVVICDEAYIDFGGESALPLTEKYDNLLVVQTMSKSRAMAGMRVGWAFGNEKLIKYLNDVRNSFNSYTLNRAAILCGAAAIRDRDTLEKNTGMIIKTRERTSKALKEMGFAMTDSLTNFLFCGREGVSAEPLFRALREEGIFVRYFPGERTGERLRVTVGTDGQMDVLLDFLRGYAG
ncbi:MAG: histidinol-phosphate transaminase [Lachnospiraceae bacterium]|nr:histidinol-phosphate transaminase [Lachnospiraceae bacterium]